MSQWPQTVVNVQCTFNIRYFLMILDWILLWKTWWVSCMKPEHGWSRNYSEGLSGWYLGNGDGLLLHGFVNGHSVVFSHLSDKEKSLAVILQRGQRLDGGQKKGKNPTLSNSSMQTTPPSASTMAPPSMMKPRVLGSRSTEAVRPAALLPLPEVYTWRPTTTCQSNTDSARTGVSSEVPTRDNVT